MGMTMIHPLPDGSTCTVDPTPNVPHGSILSRHLPDGRRVWGQAFSMSSGDDHAAQIAEVIERMIENPAAFHRWWLDK